jgi:lipopolysaccharide biosynthesis regulator YciM
VRWFTRAFGGDARAPRDLDAALRRALLAVLDRDLDRAEDLLARAAHLSSEEPVAYLALARLYRGRGEIGRAIRIHQNLLLRQDLLPEQRIDALAGLAADFRQGGFLQRAIASYEELLAHRPGDADALRALARLHADARDFPRALALERRLARLEKRSSRAEEAALGVEMSEAAHAEGRSEDARRILKRAMRRDPLCIGGWIHLGVLEAERGRPKKALAAWKRVPQLDRRAGPGVYPRLEATYAALSRAREYGDFLTGLLAERPEDPGARLALARHLAARGDVEAALAEVRQLLGAQPDNLEAHGVLGNILLSNQREPEAVKEYAELLAVLDRLGHFRPRETSQ